MDSVGSGLVAFLMTDVVGSTATWEADPEGMTASIAHHDEIIVRLTHANDGQVIKARGEGDSHFLVFSNARDAVSCADEIQAAFRVTQWPGPALEVRTAVHIGEAVTRNGDYYGPTVNRCSRIRALAFGGQVLISDAVYRILQETPAPKWRFIDLGSHRLKDLLRPERLWHVQNLNDPQTFEPLRSFSSTPNNLPIQLTEFIGRKRDVEEAQDLVRRHRIVTLLGAGGSGKTRLAIQVAAEMADDFADGVWWVDLAATETGEGSLAPVLAKALGVPPNKDVQPWDAIDEWARGKHCLVILDNCEQIVEAVCDAIGRLAASGNALHILATSRHTLNASGERVYTVPTLSFPDKDALLDGESCMGYEAIELLVERARMRDARFTPTAANAKGLAEICRRLDGLPLAIELAAPKLTFLGVDAMVKRLDDVFRLLHGGSSQALPRHKTIDTAIEWSYGLLTREEQALFLRLSVFVAPWTLEQAEAICAYAPLEEGEAVEHLIGLRDKSLITAVHGDTGDRYALLEPIRQFAERKLREVGGEVEAFSHLSGWYAAASRQAEGSLHPEDLNRWQETLDFEYENARRALIFATQTQEIESAYQIAVGLHRYWFHRCLYEEATARIDAVLALGRPADEGLYARLLNILGVSAWFQADWAAAEQNIREALAIWQANQTLDRASGAITNLGLIAIRRGDIEGARKWLLEGIEMAEANRNYSSAINSLQNLATLERDLGNFEEGAQLYRQALNYKGVGLDERTRGILEGNLASCLVMLGHIKEAIPLLRSALQVAARSDNQDRMEAILRVLARIALGAGNGKGAAEFSSTADRIRGDVDLQDQPGFEKDLRDGVWQDLALKTPTASDAKSPAKSIDTLVADAIRWLESLEESSLRGGLH